MSGKNGFVCENCGVEFWRYGKSAKYCSLSCKSSAVNKRRAKEVEVLCVGCDKVRKYSVYKEDSLLIDKYCSKKCYANHQIERLTKQCRKIGKESASVISEKAKRRHKEKGHPWTGRKHLKHSKKKMSKSAKTRFSVPENNPMYGKTHTKEAREKISEKVSKAYIEGRMNFKRCNRGYYFSEKNSKKHFYRSSWERAFFEYLDGNSRVLSYDNEKIRIPYRDSIGARRYYIPDLLIKYTPDSKELVEIKPSCYMNKKINKLKFKAAKEYCKKNNIRFKVITEKYLKYIGCI